MSEQWKDSDYKLCYIYKNTACFTTKDVTQQWGDDWNDAPYEHNAGDPYGFTDYDRAKGREPYDLRDVGFSSMLRTPEQYASGGNSAYSIEMINHGATAWLRDEDYKVQIFAGCTLPDFRRIIRENGGCTSVDTDEIARLEQELKAAREGETAAIEALDSLLSSAELDERSTYIYHITLGLVGGSLPFYSLLDAYRQRQKEQG